MKPIEEIAELLKVIKEATDYRHQPPAFTKVTTGNTTMKHVPYDTRSIHGGVQKLYRFPNNYGASVIQHTFSYGHEQALWELGVLRFNGPDWHLDFDTPITTNVIGHCSLREIEILLDEIEALPNPE
jgi:hypothetical protein